MSEISVNNSTGFMSHPDPIEFDFIPWAFFNSIVIVCGALGNMLVVLAYRNPRMKTVTNLFIANLAFADLNVVLINVPMNILKMKLDTWPFGVAICKIVTSLLGITLAASVGSLIAIAVDRHRAIVHPLKPRIRTRHAFYILIAIWISAIALATPMLVFSKVDSEQGCLEEWPSGTVFWQRVYSVFIFVTMYVLPLGSMSGLYLMIYLNLMEKKPLQKSAHRARVSVVRMLIMVVVVFGLCWLPFNVMIQFDIRTMDQSKFYAMSFSLWLTTANSCFNPIIYAVFNLNYRREFARILTCGTVSVGKYLGCDASIDDPRSQFSKTTFRKSHSQPMAMVSTTNGGHLYVENGEESEDIHGRREINGNNYGGVRNTCATASSSQRKDCGTNGESCDKGPLYESCC